MAVTVDSTGSTTASAGTTVTLSHTVGAGSDRVLVVLVAIDDSTPGFPSSVTYNGVSMTNLGGVGTTNNPLLVDGWYLVNPDTGAHNVVVTKDSGRPTAVAAISLFGGSTPNYSNGQGADGVTSSTLNITASKSGMAIDVIMTSASTPTVDASQTEFGTNLNFNGTEDMSCSYKTVAAGTPTMSWTFASTDYAHGGLFVPEASSAFTPKVMMF